MNDVKFPNPVEKNEFIGKYTGELISQVEADERGKLYDGANYFFLFDFHEEVRVSFQLRISLDDLKHSIKN